MRSLPHVKKKSKPKDVEIVWTQRLYLQEESLLSVHILQATTDNLHNPWILHSALSHRHSKQWD